MANITKFHKFLYPASQFILHQIGHISKSKQKWTAENKQTADMFKINKFSSTASMSEDYNFSHKNPLANRQLIQHLGSEEE